MTLTFLSHFKCSENGLEAVSRLKPCLQYRFPNMRVSFSHRYVTLLRKISNNEQNASAGKKRQRDTKAGSEAVREDDGATLCWCVALSADCLAQNIEDSGYGSTRNYSGERTSANGTVSQKYQSLQIGFRVSFFCESRVELSNALSRSKCEIALELYDLFKVFVIAHQPEVCLDNASSSISPQDVYSCTARTAISVFTKKNAATGVDEFSSAVKYMRTRLMNGVPSAFSAAGACERIQWEERRLKLPAAVVLLESACASTEYSLADILARVVIYAFEGVTVDIQFTERLLPKYLLDKQGQSGSVQDVQLPPHKLRKFTLKSSPRSLASTTTPPVPQSQLCFMILDGPKDSVYKAYTTVEALCDDLLANAALRCDERNDLNLRDYAETSSKTGDESLDKCSNEFQSLRALLANGYSGGGGGGTKGSTDEDEDLRLVKIRKAAAAVGRLWIERTMKAAIKHRRDAAAGTDSSSALLSPILHPTHNDQRKQESPTKHRHRTEQYTNDASPVIVLTKKQDAADDRRRKQRKPIRRIDASASDSSSVHYDKRHASKDRQPLKPHPRRPSRAYSSSSSSEDSRHHKRQRHRRTTAGDEPKVKRFQKQQQRRDLDRKVKVSPRHRRNSRLRRSSVRMTSISGRNNPSPSPPSSLTDTTPSPPLEDHAASSMGSSEEQGGHTPYSRRRRRKRAERNLAREDSFQLTGQYHNRPTAAAHDRHLPPQGLHRTAPPACDTRWTVVPNSSKVHPHHLSRISTGPTAHPNRFVRGADAHAAITCPLEKPHCTNKVWYTHGSSTHSIGYAPPPGYTMRSVVLDGQNIACLGGQYRDWANVLSLADWLKSIPSDAFDIKIVIPQRVLSESKKDKYLESLRLRFDVVGTPGGKCGSKEYLCYDDNAVVQIAEKHNACIISNDRYRDLIARNPSLKETIESQLISIRMDKSGFLFVFRGKVQSLAETPFWIKN